MKSLISCLRHFMNRGATLAVAAASMLLFSASASAQMSPASGQISLVQVKSCGPGPFPATTCAITASKSGNLVVVGWASAWGTAPSIESITDNAGNVYAPAGESRSYYGDLMAAEIWYAKNTKAGATAITITPSAQGNEGAAMIWEFSGFDTVSPLSQTSVLNDQPSTTVAEAASVTTTTPNELIISVLGPVGPIISMQNGTSFPYHGIFYGNGWTYLVAPAPGEFRPVWSIAGGEHHSSTVSFRSAASATSPCDVNGDGITNVLDVQSVVNMLPGGTAACTVNITGVGVCNTTTVQRVAIAVLGGACVVDGGSSDTTPPVVSVVSPASGSIVNGNITVAAAAADNVALAGVQFFLDGVSIGPEVLGSGPNYSISLNTTTVANGQHSLTARARDTSGNIGNSPAVSINVQNATTAPRTVTLSWTASVTPGVTYNVYRSSTSGGPYSKINSAPISGLSYVDSNVVAGQTYYYVGRSVDSRGVESSNSNQTTVPIPVN